jgi:Flp pilus assembly protein TadD
MARRVSRLRESTPRAAEPAPAPAQSRFLVPVAILGAALFVRLVVLAQLGGHPLLAPGGVLDDAVFVRLASRIASGDLLLGPEPYFLSPLYTYVLGLVFAASGGSMMSARIVQALLGTASVGFVMATAALWFGRRAGILAGILAATTGVIVFNEILVLQSAIDPFVTSVAIYLLARAVRAESRGAAVAAGAALGALALNRPNALLVIAAVGVAWAIARRSRAGFLQAGALVLGAALIVAPVAVRNRVVAGEWIAITSHGGLNFYIGNSPGADGTWHAVDGVRSSIDGQIGDVKMVAARALGRPVTATEASDYFYGLAWQWMRSHPGEWLALLARKCALAFNATDVALNYSYTYFARDETSLLSALVVGPWLLIPLGLFGLVMAAPEARRAAYAAWAMVVPAYAVSIAVFFISSRYRLAMLVPLTVAAGAGADWLWRSWRASSARLRASSLAGLAAAAVVVNWPLVPDLGRQFQRGERVVQLISDGQVSEGVALLERTAPAHPDAGILLYRVGLAFRERREPAQAVTYLRRAHALEPAEPHIDLNLGEALLETGEPAEAIPFLESARAARVETSTVTYDLVGAHHALGQTAEARRLLASIEIAPGMDGRALEELGSAALELEDPLQAERFLRSAVSRPGATIMAYQKLGAALAIQGRAAEAVAALERAVSLEPGNNAARVELAMALAQAGRQSEARSHVEAVLRADPRNPEAARLLAELGTRR